MKVVCEGFSEQKNFSELEFRVTTQKTQVERRMTGSIPSQTRYVAILSEHDHVLFQSRKSKIQLGITC